MKLYYFYTLKALWDGQVKLRCIMGCPGLKISYQEKGLLAKVYFVTVNTILVCIVCISFVFNFNYANEWLHVTEKRFRLFGLACSFSKILFCEGCQFI